MGLLEDAIREHLELKRKHGASDQEVERQEVEALGPVRREPAPEDEAGAEPAGHPEAEIGDEGVVDEPLEVPFGEDPVDNEPLAGEPPLLEREEEDPSLAHEASAGEPPLAETDEPELPIEAEPELEPELPPDPPLESQVPPAHELPPDPDAESAYSSSVDQPTEFYDVEEALRTEGAGDPDEPPARGDTPPRGFPAQERADEPGSFMEGDEEPFADEPPESEADADGDDADVLEDTPDFLQDAPEHDRLWFEQKPPRDFDFD